MNNYTYSYKVFNVCRAKVDINLPIEEKKYTAE